jgi:hypothetical protein
VVRRIQSGDPETDYYLRLLQANVVHPNVIGLIFHPAEKDPTAEAVVDEALSYRPSAL